MVESGWYWILPLLNDRDHSILLPHLGKVMGVENCVVDTGKEGNHSPGKMLQCPVWYTVRARSLADLETPDGFVNLVRGG